MIPATGGIWIGEDPYEETERRALAAAIHHDLDPDDLEGFLHLGTGREDSVTIAEETANGATIITPNVEAVIDTIKELQLDVVVLDPFVSTHRVNENDNNAIDRVVKQWAKIADTCNVAIELVHHTRKTNGAETTVEDGRGAGALVAGVRNARVLNPMTTEERDRAGVAAGEAYFRVDGMGKANLTPPSSGATWYAVSKFARRPMRVSQSPPYQTSAGMGQSSWASVTPAMARSRSVARRPLSLEIAPSTALTLT